MVTKHDRALRPRARRRSLWEWPGIRTFGSPRFRIVVAATLLLVAVGLLATLLVRQAGDPEGQYGIDFVYWHLAAHDVAAGRSPYPARYLEAPVIATDFGYKYPPLFAQMLSPLSGLPFFAAATVWAAVQTTLAFLAIWIAAISGGAKRGLEPLLWSGVAAALYLPLWDSIWKGNVSAVQAFQLALILGAGVIGGVALASAILLKTTPLALAPAAAAQGGRLLRGTVAGGVVIFVVSFSWSPDAWLDFVRIQVNLFVGPSESPTNIHPSSLAALAFPDVPILAGVTRAITLVLGGTAILAAAILARQGGRWPASVLLGVVAMLTIPGSIWYHYLALLLPPAAFAWPAASRRQRAAMAFAAAAVTFGLAWLPLATIGATVLAVAVLRVLISERARTPSGAVGALLRPLRRPGLRNGV